MFSFVQMLSDSFLSIDFTGSMKRRQMVSELENTKNLELFH